MLRQGSSASRSAPGAINSYPQVDTTGDQKASWQRSGGESITRNTFPTGLLLRGLLGNLGFDVCFSETRAEKGRACCAPALESPLLYDRYHKKKQAYAQGCKPKKQR